MIEVSAIRKVFKLSKQQQKIQQTSAAEVCALDGVSFQCKPGRITALLGPNGAGKTTLLRIMATLLKPSSGNVLIDGLDVLENGIKVRSKIGFLTGTTGLYDRLTPYETVKYFADLNRMSKDVFKQRKAHLFDVLGMQDFANRPIGKLSVGMRQKTSLARTLIHDPEVIIFDEPTSGLDVITAENIMDLIRDCKTEGKTIIFSSHVLSEVELLADDLVILHKGKVLFADTMEVFRAQMQTDTLTKEFIRIIKEGVV